MKLRFVFLPVEKSMTPIKENKYFKEQYFKSSEEMHQVFSDLPELIQNTNELAKDVIFI